MPKPFLNRVKGNKCVAHHQVLPLKAQIIKSGLSKLIFRRTAQDAKLV